MGVLVSCFLNMTGNFKLGLALLIAFSYPASSQRLFSRSRGNLLRQAAVARNAQLVEKDAAFDELEQLTLGDSDRSSSFPDVARSSPVSESAAFLPVEPARSQPIPVGQLSQSQPILVNQPQHSGQPRQVRVSAVPQAQPSSFTPSYSSGAPTPSQIRSLGPSGSSQVSSLSPALRRDVYHNPAVILPTLHRLIMAPPRLRGGHSLHTNRVLLVSLQDSLPHNHVQPDSLHPNCVLLANLPDSLSEMHTAVYSSNLRMLYRLDVSTTM